jgi:hypothetical protein
MEKSALAGRQIHSHDPDYVPCNLMLIILPKVLAV